MAPHPRARRRRRAVAIAACLLGAYALLTLVAWRWQRQVVWPMSVEEPVDRPVPPGARLVWIEADEGVAVEGWFFPAPGASERHPAPAVLFLHGNNEVIDHCLEYAETYPAWGASVLLVEYRGFGRSGGTPDRASVRADALAFHDWLRRQPEVDARRIVLHGRSIGGAVAAELAVERPPAALVLVSTFTSMADMFRRYGVPGFVVRDDYRTADALARLDVPVLVLHGTRDDIIPVAQGRALGALATRYVEHDANHDLPAEWSLLERDLLDFLVPLGLAVRPAAGAAPPSTGG